MSLNVELKHKNGDYVGLFDLQGRKNRNLKRLASFEINRVEFWDRFYFVVNSYADDIIVYLALITTRRLIFLAQVWKNFIQICWKI